jgi:hypothetical protein
MAIDSMYMPGMIIIRSVLMLMSVLMFSVMLVIVSVST